MLKFLSQIAKPVPVPRLPGTHHLDLVKAGLDQTKQTQLSNTFRSHQRLSTSAHLNPTTAPLLMLSEEDYIRIKSRLNRYHVHRHTGNIVYAVRPHKIRRFNPKTFISDDDAEADTDEVGIKRTGYWHINGDYIGPVY